jgi:hypothetical protein
MVRWLKSFGVVFGFAVALCAWFYASTLLADWLNNVIGLSGGFIAFFLTGGAFIGICFAFSKEGRCDPNAR